MCEEGLHDPFQDQVDCARFRAERDMLAQAMERVADEIEQTFLGFEGAEDAPAMRWAREFRSALGSLHAPGFQKSQKVATSLTPHSDASDVTMSAHDLLTEEEREALAWVRGQGGLDEIRRQRRDSVPRAAYERNLAKRQRQVDESHAALRRRNRWIAELEHLLCKEMSYSLRRDAGCLAPKVYDADGAEIRAGETLYRVGSNDVATVRQLMPPDRFEDTDFVKHFASEHTHHAPVFEADDKPLREGETVWGTGREQHEYVVLGQPGLGGGTGRFKVACHDVTADIDCDCDPDLLTHKRPADKCRDCAHWQKDPTADMGVCWFFYHEHEGQDCYAARRGDIGACKEFERRAKALAERG